MVGTEPVCPLTCERRQTRAGPFCLGSPILSTQFESPTQSTKYVLVSEISKARKYLPSSVGILVPASITMTIVKQTLKI